MQKSRRVNRDISVSRGPEVHLHRQRVAKARQAGADVIDLGFADVEQDPPFRVLGMFGDHLTRDRPLFHYGLVPGLESLRVEVANYLSIGAAPVSADNIVITAGGNNGVVIALMATTIPGDHVVVPAPFFFNHVTQIQLVGCTPHLLVTHSADDYMFSNVGWERALGQREVGAALLTNPRNPTSTEMTDPELRAMLEIARQRSRIVIVDESYREFSLHHKPTWGVEEGLIRVGSLSKSFCLAGWRVGYMVVPDSLLDDVIRAQDAMMIHPAIASQQVALAAFTLRKDEDYVGRLANEMAARRHHARDILLQCEWITNVFADAGTYVWAKLSDNSNADQVAELLLKDCGVGILSGMAFGQAGRSCLRIGVGCVNAENLTLALNRLRDWRR